MNPKLKKSLKIATIVFAVFGLLVCAAVGVALWHERSDKKALGEDVLLLESVFGGTPTRFGVIVKHADHESQGVVLRHYLIEVIAKQVAKDGKQQIAVLGVRELKPEISAKIENNEMDVAKIAAAGTLDLLVDKAKATWSVGALIAHKKGAQWESGVWTSDLFVGPAGDTAPTVSFPDLSSKFASFATRDGDGAEQFFALVGEQFKQVLYVSAPIDDLQDCLDYRARAAEAKPAVEQSPVADSEAAEGSTVVDPDEEEGVETEPDFVCAKAQASTKVLSTVSNNFRDIEVTLEGEGPAQVHKQKRYVLRYSSKDKAYGFGRAADRSLQTDAVDDFIAHLD